MYDNDDKELKDYIDEFLMLASRAINDGQTAAWHQLPPWLGILNLLALRVDLRKHSLFDPPDYEETERLPWEERKKLLDHRTADGKYNDLEKHDMGSAGTPFAHNLQPARLQAEQMPELMHPNPHEISQKLLIRGEGKFIPQKSVNLLAAAWIQFQVHGWFDHERDKGNFLEVPVNDTATWPKGKMLVERTKSVGAVPQDGPPVYRNTETHWWDGSQIYGSSAERLAKLRSGLEGKLKVEGGRLPEEDDPEKPGVDLTGFNRNYWVGLSLMHTLFVLEHNAICDALRAKYTTWEDERLFQTARLINCALMAKIHTIEWTPGALAHETLEKAMDANWWGIFSEDFRRDIGRIADSELLSGILGSSKNHHGADFAVTEEFVSVYRMHPLLPDNFEISIGVGEPQHFTFDKFQGKQTRAAVDLAGGMANLFRAFGQSYPGKIVLHNSPRGLAKFEMSNGKIVDVGAVDILRDRERGVPRYNKFRRLLRLRPAKDFQDLTGCDALSHEAESLFHSGMIDEPTYKKLKKEAKHRAKLAAEIETVYRDIELVDLMVGMFAERPPQGFIFSDTAFRIFILMASRRLKSDRFFTTDYNEETYTEIGLEWIDNNTMADVIVRHFPELGSEVNRANAFAPWK